MSDMNKISPSLMATTTRLQEEVQELKAELNGIKPAFFEMDPTRVQNQISQIKKKINLKLNALKELTKGAERHSEIQKMFDQTL